MSDELERVKQDMDNLGTNMTDGGAYHYLFLHFLQINPFNTVSLADKCNPNPGVKDILC